jgi:GNAT superfamily N-acetyltransferase
MITTINEWKIFGATTESVDSSNYVPQFTDGTMESDGNIYGTVHLIDTGTKRKVGELEYIVCPDHIYLEYIRIWDDYRSRGLSKTLYNAFEQHIVKYDKKLIKLDAQPLDKLEEGDPVDGDMNRLVNMYRRFGYTIDNNGPTVDDVSTPMYKNL